jgi:hypothetical protein
MNAYFEKRLRKKLTLEAKNRGLRSQQVQGKSLFN